MDRADTRRLAAAVALALPLHVAGWGVLQGLSYLTAAPTYETDPVEIHATWVEMIPPAEPAPAPPSIAQTSVPASPALALGPRKPARRDTVTDTVTDTDTATDTVTDTATDTATATDTVSDTVTDTDTGSGSGSGSASASASASASGSASGSASASASASPSASASAPPSASAPDPKVCLAALSTHLRKLTRGDTLAVRRGLTGRVKVRFKITPDGRPIDLAVAAPSASSLLDAEALDLVRRAAPLPRCPGVITVPIDLALE